jgi:hypothetical protein
VVTVKKGNASFLNTYKPTVIPPPLKKPALRKKGGKLAYELSLD